MGNINPQIDHFFPKSLYPYLAVSYFNLIPSCQTCNGFGAKENKDPIIEKLVNPYLIKDDDFRFAIKINSIDIYNPVFDPSNFDLILKKKIEGHVKTFKLEGFYEKHKDHVFELIIKSKLKYSEKYREYLKSLIGHSFCSEDIDKMIIGNYSRVSEIHKRPLAKLYQDIAKELKLIR